MALLGEAILAVWNEVAPADEADFAEWYVREHIPERTSVPGMTRGRKYRAIDGGSPANMALYEARSLDVLTSGAYRTQLANPTEWTKRVTSRFTFMRRAICSVVADAGQGEGGFATVFHFTPTAAARAWVERLVPELVTTPGIVAAHCWVAADGEPATPTSRLSDRAVSEPPVDWVLAIDATDLVALRVACDAVTSGEAAARGGVEPHAYPIYRLQYALTAS
jgi:hypothetical protein